MSSGTITVRLVRSFEHRNIKHIVLHDVDFTQTVNSFKEAIKKDLVSMQGIPPPFKKYSYDTLKISHKAHGAKSNDPVIDIANDQLILEDGVTLVEAGVGNETEISYFKMEDYRKYQADPHLVW
ncbi:UPF0538 protein C2orf76 homolog isoform X1 [Mytilus galloprovincialis]|uniref:Uncharacterized protein n=2 Tax=Mytilus galloprovincialis TaxID=29158 RepID=A0A8B6G7J1_MYTGA|nr:Hypothetical predicted protein [Mytilus galloprovincialis]